MFITVTHCATTNKESACRIICMLCQQTLSNRWFANVNMTSYCGVTNSVYWVTMTTIRHCSILEFITGHTIKESPRASPDLCTSLIFNSCPFQDRMKAFKIWSNGYSYPHKSSKKLKPLFQKPSRKRTTVLVNPIHTLHCKTEFRNFFRKYLKQLAQLVFIHKPHNWTPF